MPATTVRNLLGQAATASLATIDVGTGHPYVSLVEMATLPDGRPLLLLSRLARHTRNLEVDPRAALLIDQRTTAASPLAGERASVMGTMTRTDEPLCRARYLARFPGAEAWVGFGDFGFFVMDIASAHLIAGFGRIVEVPGSALSTPTDTRSLDLSEG